MTTAQLQDEIAKEKAALAAAEERIAQLNAEVGMLRHVAAKGGSGNAVADANNRFKELITNLQNGIFLVDEHKNIVVVNEMFCKMFGIVVPPEGLIGTNGDQVTAQMRPLFKDPEAYRLRTQEILRDKRKVLKDELELLGGQVFTRDFIPIFLDGEYRGHLWKFTDVTRNRTIEATFETQRLFYEQILNNISADVVVCTPDFRYLFVNPTAIPDPELRKWMIGKTNEEFCRRLNRPVAFTEKRRRFFDAVLATKKQNEWEEELMLPDGRTVCFLRKMYPVVNSLGVVEVTIEYGVDITERKKIEQQVQLSEKRYRDIFSFSQAWICTHDMQGNILSINESARSLLEHAERELIGRPIEAFMPERVRSRFKDTYMAQIYADGKSEGIMSVVSKTGKKLFLLYQNFLVNEPGIQPYVIGFAQNITERVEMEEALKRSEEKYRGIIENMNLGMLELDVEEHIIYANQRFCTMSGYTRQELLGKRATDLFLSGASSKRVSAHISRRAYETTSSYELPVKTKPGEDHWWLISAAPIFNAEKVQTGTVGIHLDITQQKKMEQQLREAKMYSERAATSKDVFLTNMSHEIRTPLNAIMGLGKLLSKSELDVQQKNYLAGIESASDNLLGIINDLLDFSKIEAGKITIENISFNLELVCTQLINLLSHKAEEKGLELSSVIDARIAPVLIGDPFRINQVFTNMLSNAIKFTEKGSISLKAGLIEETNGVQKVLVTITDTGVGIKEEYIEHLFDKFTQEDETVVRKFGGTGLGMSITKQLIELMGGTIEVRSKKNVGTTIMLTFNLAVGTARVLEKKKTIKNDTSNIANKKILLVEDNNLNRLLATTILADYGAVIVEAINGQEAIDCMKKEQFDIVLMDIQMPVMDGVQATQIIRKEIDKTIPIIALTANAIKGKLDQFLEAGMDDFIYKPYNEINLVNPIAKWLNKRAETQDKQSRPNKSAEQPASSEVAKQVAVETKETPPVAAAIPPLKQEPVAEKVQPQAPVLPDPVVLKEEMPAHNAEPAASRSETAVPKSAPAQQENTAAAREPQQARKSFVITDNKARPAEPIYDLTKLKNIGRNDTQFIVKMVKLFIEELPPAVEKIKEAQESEDVNTITYLSHRIKPSLLNMGINSIKSEILQLEGLRDKTPSKKEMKAMTDKVYDAVMQACEQLKVEYNL